ncbi:hypothetical protein ACLOJK_016343 [Asimina triloba]
MLPPAALPPLVHAQLLIVPHMQLDVPADDPRLLVVPRCISRQLQHLSSEVFQDDSKIDMHTSADVLGDLQTFKKRAIRLTGNCRPALLLLDMAFLEEPNPKVFPLPSITTTFLAFWASIFANSNLSDKGSSTTSTSGETRPKSANHHGVIHHH